jgi:membrane protein
VIAAFTFVYRYIPNARVKTRAALFGGVVAGLAWKGAGRVFSGFVASSAQYHAVYSSFAILVLFMIWLYVSWLIVLLGVQVSFYYQHPRYCRFSSAHIRLGPRSFERTGLMVMWLVGRRFILGEPAWSAESLSERLELPEDSIDELLEVLHAGGLVMPVDVEARTFAPARDLSSISLRELLEVLRAAHEEGSFFDAEVPRIEAIDGFFAVMQRAIADCTGTTSLRDLVTAAEAARTIGPTEPS